MNVLRLNPTHPPLWRSDRVLQFGTTARAVVDDPEPWQLRLLHDLQVGIPHSAVELLGEVAGGTARQARHFVQQLRPVLQAPAPQPVRRVVVEAAAGDAAAVTVCAALAAAGVETDVVDGGDRVPERTERGIPRLLVAHHALPPERGRAALRDDAPHVPIVFTGDTAEVGPFVTAGETACLTCVHGHRCEADDAWPLLFVQLLALPARPVDARLAAEAAQLAVHLMRGPGGRSATLTAHSARRVWRSHAPHPACGCRSPQGSATGSVATARPTATTTVPACALPA